MPIGSIASSRCRTASAMKTCSAPRFDLALFTVKAYDTLNAIEPLRVYADRIDRFLTLQNGVSNEDLLGAAFGSGAFSGEGLRPSQRDRAAARVCRSDRSLPHAAERRQQ